MSRETNMRGQAQASAQARSYSYGQHGRQTRGMMGDHVLTKGSGCEVWKPSWKATTTTLRVFPALCPENPETWDPWRFSGDDTDDYGDWLRTYPAVRNFGDPGVTFILFDPTDQGYDPQTNPAWVLYNAITRALDAGQGDPKWVPYTKGSQGRGAALKRPQDITLIQAAILQHNNKDYDPPRGGAANDATCVIELSGSAAGAMLEAMNERNPEFRGDPDDFRNMFRHGDPIAIDQGAFVNFFQLGQDPRERMQANAQRRGSSFGQTRNERRGGGGAGSDDPIGFGCFMSNDYKGMPPDLSGVEDLIKRKWKPWDSIIQILDHEQQVRLLSGAFPADMIIYALGDHFRDAIPEPVWRQYQSRSVQGGGPGAHGGAPANAPPAQQGNGRRGWGAQAPDAPPVEGGSEGYDDNGGDSQEAPPEPQQAPPARRSGFGGTAQGGAPAGQRRGFGAPAPTDGAVTVGETAPRAELPDRAPTQAPPVQAPPVQAPPPAGGRGFDQRPAATTPPASGVPTGPGNAIQDAIRASKERIANKQRQRPGAQ